MPSRTALPTAHPPAVAEERIVGQRPQRRVDDADPVDRALGVHVHPQVLQAGVPGPALEHDKRDHAADDDVRQRRGQLLGHRGAAVGLLGGELEHGLQPVRGQRLGQRPPPPA